MEQQQEGLVRRAALTGEEFAAVAELVAVCNAFDQLDFSLVLEIAKEYEDRESKDSNIYLYYEHNRLVGALVLDSFGTEDKELNGVVHPEYRRKGIFTALTNAARSDVPERGIHQLTFLCDRFSQSGQAFIQFIGAKYDFSEHSMILRDFKEHEPYKERILLRPAFMEDAPLLAHITATSFGESERRTQEHLKKDIVNPRRRYFLASWGNEPVGCFNLWLGNTIGIYAFCVRPEYRRHGFARQMLEQIIRQIRRETTQDITLEVDTTNTAAIALYHAVGFQEITTVGYYTLTV